jgi:hypothetical protein
MDFRKDMIDVISERQHATARLARSKNKKFKLVFRHCPIRRIPLSRAKAWRKAPHWEVVDEELVEMARKWAKPCQVAAGHSSSA